MLTAGSGSTLRRKSLSTLELTRKSNSSIPLLKLRILSIQVNISLLRQWQVPKLRGITVKVKKEKKAPRLEALSFPKLMATDSLDPLEVALWFKCLIAHNLMCICHKSFHISLHGFVAAPA